MQRNRWDALHSKIFEDDEANSGVVTKEVLGFGFTLCYMLKNFLNVILLLTNENLTNYGTKVRQSQCNAYSRHSNTPNFHKSMQTKLIV